jgi:hypothetical protein
VRLGSSEKRRRLPNLGSQLLEAGVPLPNLGSHLLEAGVPLPKLGSQLLAQASNPLSMVFRFSSHKSPVQLRRFDDCRT